MLVTCLPHRPILPRRRVSRSLPKASIDWQESVALTGKGIGLFVLFTSSMNWWFYRKVRKDLEKDDDSTSS